jgi:hypothetical protein
MNFGFSGRRTENTVHSFVLRSVHCIFEFLIILEGPTCPHSGGENVEVEVC